MQDPNQGDILLEQFLKDARRLTVPLGATAISDYKSSVNDVLNVSNGERLIVFAVSFMGWCYVGKGKAYSLIPYRCLSLNNDSGTNRVNLHNLSSYNETSPNAVYCNNKDITHHTSCMFYRPSPKSDVANKKIIIHDESVRIAFKINKIPKASTIKACRNCGTNTTPEWRNGPDGFSSLCNACGIRWRRHNDKVQIENAQVKAQGFFEKTVINTSSQKTVIEEPQAISNLNMHNHKNGFCQLVKDNEPEAPQDKLTVSFLLN
jgi:hypothetical protein